MDLLAEEKAPEGAASQAKRGMAHGATRSESILVSGDARTIDKIHAVAARALLERVPQPTFPSQWRSDRVHRHESKDSVAPLGTAGRCRENPTSADLLHYIRAMVKRLRGAPIEPPESRDQGAKRVLGKLLRNAIDSASALDIVVTLGCAAELSLFPEDAILEQCTTTVGAAGNTTLMGAMWAVRHRCARAGNHYRRFTA